MLCFGVVHVYKCIINNNSNPTHDDVPNKFPFSRQHVDRVSLEKRKVGNAAVCTGKERKTGE